MSTNLESVILLHSGSWVMEKSEKRKGKGEGGFLKKKLRISPRSLWKMDVVFRNELDIDDETTYSHGPESSLRQGMQVIFSTSSFGFIRIISQKSCPFSIFSGFLSSIHNVR